MKGAGESQGSAPEAYQRHHWSVIAGSLNKTKNNCSYTTKTAKRLLKPDNASDLPLFSAPTGLRLAVTLSGNIIGFLPFPDADNKP